MARPCDGRILRARPSLDDDAVKKCETESAVRKVAGQELLTGSWLYNMSRENLRLCQKMIEDGTKETCLGSCNIDMGIHVFRIRGPSLGSGCAEPAVRGGGVKLQT